MSTARAFCAALGLLLLGLASSAEAGVGDYVCSDPSKVYYGNQRLFQRPAVVDCNRIYANIAEYKEIVRRRLTEKHAQYHILMKRASKRFAAAVKKMARAKNHDLVACVGSVKKAKKSAKDIPDRTNDVIKALD